jgi:hypothetical protein
MKLKKIPTTLAIRLTRAQHLSAEDRQLVVRQVLSTVRQLNLLAAVAEAQLLTTKKISMDAWLDIVNFHHTECHITRKMTLENVVSCAQHAK